jgi:hypothetical protein
MEFIIYLIKRNNQDIGLVQINILELVKRKCNFYVTSHELLKDALQTQFPF